MLAAGSAEMAVDLLAAGNGYKRTARCTGHSGTITGVDFSEDFSFAKFLAKATDVRDWNLSLIPISEPTRPY